MTCISICCQPIGHFDPVVGHVHAKTPKRGFTLKTNQMFVVYATLEEFENTKNAVILDFWFEKTRIDRENHIIVVFKKLRSPTAFLLRQNVKLALLNSSRLKNVLNKLRFRDGLMWKVGLTVEIKLGFQVFPANVRLLRICGEFTKPRRRQQRELTSLNKRINKQNNGGAPAL